MKEKRFLLPRMAVNNIRKNGSSYFPYIGVSIFAVFTYFSFDLLMRNDVMKSIPRANYALSLIVIGFALLGFILIPFLYYINSFLIKRRKKELGLYSILGLEKKHIGIMMFWESLLLYLIVLGAAVGMGLLFARLIFLILLNLAHLPVNITFSVSPRAIADTAKFYAFIMALNLVVNLFQVGKSNPVELMRDSKKGEKEPKHILLFSLIGVCLLGGGYSMALRAKLDSMIFVSFFFAVLCVVAGTYYLFTSGSIFLLRRLKKNNKYYYRPDHFVAVSGMLYRMRKSAASLSNICIFSTMVIVTAVCTLSLYLGMDFITEYSYPQDCSIHFAGANMIPGDALDKTLQEEAEQYGAELKEQKRYSYLEVSVTQKENEMRRRSQEDPYAMWYPLKLMTLEEYNRLEGAEEVLHADEVLVYSTGEDFGYDTIVLGERAYQVKTELSECRVGGKERQDFFNMYYTVILPDEHKLKETAAFYGVDADTSMAMECAFTPVGDEDLLDGFYESIYRKVSGMSGFAAFADYRGAKQDVESTYGGLLFVGIFFGLIFLVCLMIILYYKQVAEGIEDKQNFEIMQKVGMDDEEIRRTIRKQIRTVFLLPLLGAVCHTMAAMQMVIPLMGAIYLFETQLIIACAVGVTVLFALFYVLCYRQTAGTYYRIVR